MPEKELHSGRAASDSDSKNLDKINEKSIGTGFSLFDRKTSNRLYPKCIISFS